jgi:hypothetical protein
MLHPTQELEPPANPVRFSLCLTDEMKRPAEARPDFWLRAS